MDLDITALRGWAAAHTADMLEDLRALVECETPSDDLDALAGGLALVREWITRRLGPAPVTEVLPGGEYGDALWLEYPGTVDGPPVVFLGHYDTVWPLGTLAEIPFAVDGDVLRGPGVFDMKAGLVQGVWALRGLAELGVPRPPVRLLVNGDEEVGSRASRPAIEKACRDAAEVYVLESAADGAVKTARKGIGRWDVRVTGIEAHAGLDPKAGASAIVGLARIVLTLTGAADLDAGTSVNVGVIDGGTRLNVTAGQAHAGAEIRVSSREEAARIEALLTALDPGDPRMTVSVTGGWGRPVMARTDAIGAVYARARDLAAGMGVALAEAAVGGGSDGNFAAALGVPVLDGLGAVGAGAHARSEHATVSGMVERCALVGALTATAG